MKITMDMENQRNTMDIKNRKIKIKLKLDECKACTKKTKFKRIKPSAAFIHSVSE